MRVCPKCGDYFADAQVAFCLADGMPLTEVDPSSEKWNEGSRAVEEKAQSLKKHKLRLKWRRVLVSAAAILISTMVLSRWFTVEVTPRALYKISGQVMNASEPLGGINVTLDGAKTASTTTDANGHYSFTGLPAGSNYTITAVPKLEMVFSEPSISIASLKQDATADFHVQPVLYTISGQVMNAREPLGDVKITLGGTKNDSTRTDENGNYSFSGLPAGRSYKVTPEASRKITFTPRSSPIESLTQDASANFSALIQPDLYKISGRVKDATGPLNGIELRLKSARTYSATTTDVRGNYTFDGLRSGSDYTVAPRSQNLDFRPPKFPISNLTQDEWVPFTGVRKRLDLTECDEQREKKTIGDIWQQRVSGDRTARIEGITLFEKCTVAKVTVSYPKRVSGNSNATGNVGNDRTERIFWCNKATGTWQCP